MLGKQEHISIMLEGNSLKVTRLKVSDKKVQILKVDKFTLVTPLERVTEKPDTDAFEDIDIDNVLTEDAIFGIDDTEDEIVDDLSSLDLDEDLNLDDIESSDEMVDLDLVDETEAPSSNELLLYNILSSIDPKRVSISLNYEAGVAFFQILKDSDFTQTKKKDLQVIIDDRLESYYGVSIASDYYSYVVREDGALLLASVDQEPRLLGLIDRTNELYTGKIFINQILPDEIALLSLFRANYDLEDDSITALLQFGSTFCRVLFFKGNSLFLVSPIIPEGTESRKFLNTVFSKILFQLDTGEVPNLDRLVIADNTLGDDPIKFFSDRFPDLDVEEFTFDEEFVDAEDISESSLSAFTTSIGIAWVASKFRKNTYPSFDFVPNYIKDRQKIFKLHWHGFLLLVCIFAMIPATNVLIRNNSSVIRQLESDLTGINTQIAELQPTVNSSNRISSDYTGIQDQLILLDTLNQGTLRWSTNLDLLNDGIQSVGSIWVTSIAENVGSAGNGPEGSLTISGIARDREKIAEIADLFAQATLLDVTLNEIRGVDVYTFTYVVSRIVENESIYSPTGEEELTEVEVIN